MKIVLETLKRKNNFIVILYVVVMIKKNEIIRDIKILKIIGIRYKYFLLSLYAGSVT